jgi:hypothetical protein
LDREIGPHPYGHSLVPVMLDEERWVSSGALNCSIGEQTPVARVGGADQRTRSTARVGVAGRRRRTGSRPASGGALQCTSSGTLQCPSGSALEWREQRRPRLRVRAGRDWERGAATSDLTMYETYSYMVQILVHTQYMFLY